MFLSFLLIRSLLCGCPSLSWCFLPTKNILLLLLLHFISSYFLSSSSLFPHLCHNWWDIYIYVLHLNVRNDCDTTLLCHRHSSFCSLFMLTRIVKKVRKGWQKRYANCLMKDKTKIRTEMIKDWGSKCKKDSLKQTFVCFCLQDKCLLMPFMRIIVTKIKRRKFWCLAIHWLSFYFLQGLIAFLNPSLCVTWNDSLFLVLSRMKLMKVGKSYWTKSSKVKFQYSLSSVVYFLWRFEYRFPLQFSSQTSYLQNKQ